MTIGKSSKKNKAPRSPLFLDKANGFYWRLDEMDGDDVQIEWNITDEPMQNLSSPDNMTVAGWIEEDDHLTEFNQGMVDDDGTTLLKRKPSRLSRRWSRKTLTKLSPGKESQNVTTETDNRAVLQEAQTKEVTNNGEPDLVHFSVREQADDQILILRKKERENELENVRKENKTEGKINGESTEIEKRNTFKNYRKAVDRALRCGWESFITNLYSVTLTPISSTSSSSPPVRSKMDRNCVLAEFR
ncbi:uncharacterized protein sb:cb1058 [Triplophysa dalaica]|uniref:uncharacterized protein sb:cb1058 n=1 Tax=Triplophysa dalaica TaxID=1582913 RepID=UPI0024DF4C69|nr:uncharacterized protein sb:cb1058 [Triplophysa dalaica]XP_056605534.1 uncharacterized protein sb:cb1058 [Triplophysa dalaica]XP_056605535.1 uncharacterized protein sb:cb1058 [Triplophysa dalaica]